MRNKLVFLLLILALGCEKEIKFDSGNFKPQLVANCIIDIDNELSVLVSKTSQMTDSLGALISNATVELWMDNILLENLPYSGDRYYKSSSNKPKEGNAYQLKISAPGFEDIVSFDTIPKPVMVTDASYVFYFQDDGKEDFTADMFIEFDDPADEKNYYELIFYTKRITYDHWDLQDSVTIINNYNEVKTDDPIIKAEGDMDYKPSSIFFSDELFNGKSQKMTFNIYTYGGGILYGVTDFDSKADKIAELRSISFSYYQYLKKWTRHLYNQGISLSIQDSEELRNFLFTGEPVNMFSNVQGGNGVFAGFSKSKFVMRRID